MDPRGAVMWDRVARLIGERQSAPALVSEEAA